MGMFTENYTGNRCSDCTWADNIEKELKQLKTWTKIKSKSDLPPECTEVMVYKKHYGVKLGYLIDRSDFDVLYWIVDGTSGGGKARILKRNPTHWKYKPEEPKE